LKLENEADLWLQFKDQGNDGARDKLILHYMRVVKYIAGRMAIHVPNNVEMDDLIGWGVMGLLDAIEKFDHRQDIKFVTYASIRIRGAIIDQIRSLDWAPRSLRSMARKVGAARDHLRQVQGREPSLSDIAETLGTSTEQIEETVAQLQTAQILSLDDYLPSDDAEESRKIDVTSGGGPPSPRAAAEERERIALLADAILQLPEQQQKVLNLYYYETLTLKEIGLVLEVTESRVCQIHSAAVKRLRKVVEATT